MLKHMSSELRPHARRRMLATCGLATIAASAIAMLMGAAPARAGGVYTTDCVYGYGGHSCTRIWRRLGNPYVMQVPRPRSEEEVTEAAARDRLWEARCRPIVRQDMYGVRRYHYFAPGCEYGKYE
jgi:hypothetical protein